MKAGVELGAILRAAWGLGGVRTANAQLLASIDRLNKVSDTIMADSADYRARAVDDLAERR